MIHVEHFLFVFTDYVPYQYIVIFLLRALETFLRNFELSNKCFLCTKYMVMSLAVYNITLHHIYYTSYNKNKLSYFKEKRYLNISSYFFLLLYRKCSSYIYAVHSMYETHS